MLFLTITALARTSCPTELSHMASDALWRNRQPRSCRSGRRAALSGVSSCAVLCCYALILLAPPLLNGCLRVKGTAEPSVQIQELQVIPSGDWLIRVRMENFNTTTLIATHLHLDLSVNDQVAALIEAAEVVPIAAQSVESVSVRLTPTQSGRLWVASALADQHPLRYRVRGTLVAHAAASQRNITYTVTRTDRLDAIPGLTGVLR